MGVPMRWVGFTRAGLTLPIIWRRAMEKRSVTKWDSDPAEELGFVRQINLFIPLLCPLWFLLSVGFLLSPCTCRLCFVYALLLALILFATSAFCLRSPKRLTVLSLRVFAPSACT